MHSTKRTMDFFHGKPIFSSNFATNAMVETAKGVQGNGNNSASGVCEDVRRLCRQGRLKEAIHILHDMNRRSIRADSSIYSPLLQACVDAKALREGKLIHAHIIQTGFNPDVFLRNRLVIMYTMCGSLADGRQVLDRMRKQNVVSCTAMIAAYSRHGHDEDALALFYQIQQMGVQPDHFTFASVLPPCGNLAALEHGKQIHEAVIRRGFSSDVFVASALVDMYVKCGRIDDARQVFDKMSERNVVSWTAMVAGYAQNGRPREALELFQRMPERNVVSWTVVIWGYSQIGVIEKALEIFQKMPERNVVSWNGMIAGYTQNGRYTEALKVFRQMQLAGVKPDSTTFTSVLPANSNLAALEHGKAVHEHLIKSGFQSDVSVGNALVDMYAKCGSIVDAHRVFDKMPERTVVSWNAMIVGHAMHGCAQEALQLFQQMQQSGMTPSEVTFIGILSACCHAGLVDDGWRYFHSMSEDYNITPAAEHYGCMVDLLGRAGRLEEAQDIIAKMPMEPGAAVWGPLLGACRIHNNMELGERVAECLFESDPKNSSHFVLLSNMYAGAGRWDDVDKVRKLMKERGVQKMQGCSWIAINNKVHAFFVGDRSHPQMDNIYAELEKLSGQIKEAGYVPDTKFVLHDVDEQQKEYILYHHSEKLAIAFGLISTSDGTPIRILKNLRVCGDCHSAIKFISQIVARDIYVRDTNRFHHFKNGRCSCGDYW